MFDVGDGALSVSRLRTTLIVLAEALLGFIQPNPINVFVLTRFEALDQTKGEPRSVSM